MAITPAYSMQYLAPSDSFASSFTQFLIRGVKNLIDEVHPTKAKPIAQMAKDKTAQRLTDPFLVEAAPDCVLEGAPGLPLALPFMSTTT